jgi:murein DD-endopeptidase MepM/ murein hydrolase activator NlpD
MKKRFNKSALLPLIAACGLVGCDRTLDLDLRSNLGGILDTSAAARNALSVRPAPDGRGIIKFLSYQVAVAKHGDRIADIADRIGINSNLLARYNGITPDAVLRNGEIVALPRDIITISNATTPLKPIVVSVSELDDRQVTGSKATEGLEPVRHKVQIGENATTIASLYDVSVSALSNWNGLGPQKNIRTGQFLLIPTNLKKLDEISVPGERSIAPAPPSAKKPKPETAKKSNKPELVADISTTKVEKSTSTLIKNTRFVRPATGNIIRAYKKGTNEGIDIGAKAGSDVLSAEKGTIAAVTKDTNGVSILVIKHDEGLLTVYTNIDKLIVKKGDSVARGQKIAEVNQGSPEFLHFEVRKGLESVDPDDYI